MPHITLSMEQTKKAMLLIPYSAPRCLSVIDSILGVLFYAFNKGNTHKPVFNTQASVENKNVYFSAFEYTFRQHRRLLALNVVFIDFVALTFIIHNKSLDRN